MSHSEPLGSKVTVHDADEVNSVKIIPGVRAIVIVHIHQVGSSCGFSMPKYDFKEFRPTLNEFFEKRVASEEAGRKEDGIERYWAYKNQESSTFTFLHSALHILPTASFAMLVIHALGSHDPPRETNYLPTYHTMLTHHPVDGLPGLRRGVETGKRENVKPIKKMVGGPYAAMIARTRKGNEKTVSVNQMVVWILMAFMTGVAGVCVAAVELGWIDVEGKASKIGFGGPIV